MADWSGLAPDLLALVTQRLCVADLIRCSCVCKSWRSILEPPRHGGLLPWLIVPYDPTKVPVLQFKYFESGYRTLENKNFCPDDVILGVLSLQDRQVHRLELPEVAGTRICGSSSTGWLATVEANSEIKLVHAFTRSQIWLPPLTEFPDLSDDLFWEEQRTFYYTNPRVKRCKSVPSTFCLDLYVYKLVVMSLDPVSSETSGWMRLFNNGAQIPNCISAGGLIESPDYGSRRNAHVSSTCPDVVFAIFGRYGRLAMFRPRATDKSWTLVDGYSINKRMCEIRFDDITYYRGRFYAVTTGGRVCVMDDGLGTSSPRFTMVTQHYCKGANNNYLVESSGELLMLSRCMVRDGTSFRSPKTMEFKVFKLDLNGPKLVEVKSLGDRSMFVGYNTSFSLPSCSGRSNCIYFTDDYWLRYHHLPIGGCDVGVFNLDEGTIEPVYPVDLDLIVPSPIWLATN